MSPGNISQKVVAGKIGIVRQMIQGIATLPLASREAFVADPHRVAAGESYLRRALEALIDLGRHVLAKGFGIVATEYKAVPRRLREQGILGEDLADRLTLMAGYRNRLVHFYEDVDDAELYRVLTEHVDDVEKVLEALRGWIQEHPDQIDDAL